MNILKILRPRHTLTEQEINTGLHWFIWEGTTSMDLFSITTSGILVAFAMALGADNFHIGVLAAIPFIMLIIQVPSNLLVEKLHRRKTIAVLSLLHAQLRWLPITLLLYK